MSKITSTIFLRVPLTFLKNYLQSKHSAFINVYKNERNELNMLLTVWKLKMNIKKNLFSQCNQIWAQHWKKIRRYRHNCGSLTYIILEIYRKPRFACISLACMYIPNIWITIAAIFLINCQIYFVELLKINQLYSNGW